MFKIRASTKIFIGFVAVLGVSWFAINKVQDAMIMGSHFAPIAPNNVNIVGITPDGYRIIISNEVAQLVETQGGFQADESDSEDDSSGGSVKKKISIMDMLGVMEGKSKSLSEFLMSMNDLSENDLPPIRVVWPKKDVGKALAGDPVMVARLEKDLNMKLDGNPLPTLSVRSVENGIVLQIPVPVDVNIAGTERRIVGNVLLAYKPRMIKAVEAEIAAEQGTISDSTYAGYYKQEGERTLKDGKRENIRQYLIDIFSDSQAKQYATYPEKILKTAFIVVNSDYITNASYTTRSGPDGKPIYDLHIFLNEEGRKRLWQYSRRRVGDQILLTSNGVAIAAARIRHPLVGGDVTITQMTDQTLLDDLIATIKNSKQGKLTQR
jgi:hypothetical protein